jgi:hypothetical protein
VSARALIARDLVVNRSTVDGYRHQTPPVRLPVLVVGGGPAGVVAALELARRSVHVRIVDQAAGPMTGSRAKGLQPRTLELLEAVGVVDEILAAGGRFPPWRSYHGAELAWEKSIYELLGMAEPCAPRTSSPPTVRRARCAR